MVKLSTHFIRVLLAVVLVADVVTLVAMILANAMNPDYFGISGAASSIVKNNVRTQNMSERLPQPVTLSTSLASNNLRSTRFHNFKCDRHYACIHQPAKPGHVSRRADTVDRQLSLAFGSATGLGQFRGSHCLANCDRAALPLLPRDRSYPQCYSGNNSKCACTGRVSSSGGEEQC